MLSTAQTFRAEGSGLGPRSRVGRSTNLSPRHHKRLLLYKLYQQFIYSLPLFVFVTCPSFKLRPQFVYLYADQFRGKPTLFKLFNYTTLNTKFKPCLYIPTNFIHTSLNHVTAIMKYKNLFNMYLLLGCVIPETDCEGITKIPVHQEGEEELLPYGPDR